jgi:hypothetical protein
LKQTILNGMAKAFFACAWAEQAEDTGNSSQLTGKEILDIMPAQMEPAAVRAANTLMMDMERANGKSIEAVFMSVRDKLEAGKFGHYAAMQAMGQGTGLVDYDISKEDVIVPYVEFGQHSLEKDYFVQQPARHMRPG